MTEHPTPAAGPPPTVAVVGLGTAGGALAARMVDAGLRVLGIDPDPAARDRAQRAEAAPEIHADPGAVAEADVVLEAVPEPAAAKRATLATLARHRRLGAPLVTTALAVPAAELETAAGRDLLALRFLHPDALDAVELARAPGAGDRATALVTRVLTTAGIAVHPAPDRAGSLAPGLLLGLLNRAAWMVHEGYAGAAEVDAAMRLGCGWREGPLALLDAIGLDTARDILAQLAESGGEHAPPAPILDKLVAQGALGHKTGHGFHRHPTDRAAEGAGARPEEERAPVAPVAPPGRNVVVVGSGVMATGIAESCVRAGFHTTLLARAPERAREAHETVTFQLQRATAAGTPGDDEELRAALDRWTATTDRSVLTGADLVIEAVVEDPRVKRQLFAELGEVCAPRTLLATSTSSLSVNACTEPAGRPAEVLGLHFFNPAPRMALVELVPARGTSPHTLARARGAAALLGKRVVECGDRPGFIVNALLFPYLNQALRLLDGGEVAPPALDAAVRAVGGQPLGPVRLLDTVGADVALEVQRRLHRELADAVSAPVPLLEQLVAEGYLGRKTAGRGVRAFLADRAAAAATPATGAA
ncbi:3-hydroxyacyl-CoA dehydrogenase family protein [Streptomyces sp. 3MP-14]|uniref:3-hydroxyacyl-CoA dehydrogenase family protein n=1 Tax=Streptomyces mimosae TaxID=2586635 RepID=A0A5N6A3J8_9ACTN|nr:MULTISPECIES: 3-hydroxyacyl-CoA dehydrogenase family protein [Streptomyces]KAB8162280.1 3-hydroxyacyl-CoA dehydrogenase family protein [Streptomyces mimosae]KAB8173821.1 3-hydroxyacyl-CoA dehydrogenase family protein [Streptomyces sp. 3MP-14]